MQPPFRPNGRRPLAGPRNAVGKAALSGLLLAGMSACSLALPSGSGALLFQDDFARSSTGWATFQGAESSANYADGGLDVQVNAPNHWAWSTPGFDLGDVRLEVDSAAMAGPPDNAFGLVCRFRDPDNFYFLLISSDGYSGIGIVRDGQRSLLTGSAMLPSDSILPGLTSNHLRADCVGPKLSLYINGALANEAPAADWLTGDVGVIVGSYDVPGVEVRFDNFSITNP